MTQFFTRAVLAAMVATSGLAVAPAAAFADGIYFGFDTGPDRGPPRGFYDRHDYGRRPPPPPRGYGCSEREALRRVWRMGLERPEVVRVTPRRVVVEGEVGRRLQQLQFANVPGCPQL